MFKEAILTQKQLDFLSYCKSINVVLDVCFLQYDEVETTIIPDISSCGAIKAIEIFSERYTKELQEINPDRDLSNYFKIKVDEKIKPTATKISYQKFLGTGFDFKNNCVQLFKYSGNSCSTIQDFTGSALVKALLNPPYSIALKSGDYSLENGIIVHEKMTKFLFEFLDTILNVKTFTDFDNYEIYKWSDDWSNYFDAGKEWWGTFYWTLLNKDTKQVIVIGASASD